MTECAEGVMEEVYQMDGMEMVALPSRAQLAIAST